MLIMPSTQRLCHKSVLVLGILELHVRSRYQFLSQLFRGVEYIERGSIEGGKETF